MRLDDGRRAGTAGCAPASCKAGSAGCAPASCKAPFRARRRPRLPATVRAAPGDGRRRPLLLRSASLHPSCSSVGAGLQSARAAPGDGWWGEPGLSLGKFSVANTHFGSQEGKWRII